MTVFQKAKDFFQGAVRQASPIVSAVGEAQNPPVSLAAIAPAANQTGPSGESFDELYSRVRAHILARIGETAVGTEPFYHSFIESIFPADFYDAVRAHMLQFKYSDKVHDRHQDNPQFMNQRYNLVGNGDDVVRCIHGIFSDPEIKLALLDKFYISPTRELADALHIHDEFEYTYTKGGRFQNIHVDIPSKFMSFVFYIPEHPAAPEEEERNATILYDKSLVPHYKARFRANSVCVFVPHFYSYHGFASTIDRDVLVMFYLNGAYHEKYFRARQQQKEEAPWPALCDTLEERLRAYPLKEYEGSEERLLAERAGCRVNAPLGRVMVTTGAHASA